VTTTIQGGEYPNLDAVRRGAKFRWRSEYVNGFAVDATGFAFFGKPDEEEAVAFVAKVALLINGPFPFKELGSFI